MDIVIKLKPIQSNPFDGSKSPTDIEERQVLRNVALETQALNSALSVLLTNGPLPCNPDSESYEGYLGDVNTRPNEFGYVTVRFTSYRKLILPAGVTPTTFDFVFGTPVEDIVGEDGITFVVSGGIIQ